MMPRVFLISPFAESISYSHAAWLQRRNVLFAQSCAADCFRRGEAPFIPHLLYTQPGILDDSKPHEREKGMTAGRRFLAVCDRAVCYLDHGCSSGMHGDLEAALTYATPIEFRRLDGGVVQPPKIGLDRWR